MQTTMLRLLAGLLLLPGAVHAIEFAAGVQLPMEQNANLNREAISASVADANADGRMDVLFFVAASPFTTQSADREFYLYEQQPDGSMALAVRQTYAPNNVAAYNPQAMVFVDLDHDAMAEIVTRGVGKELVLLKRGVDGRYAEAGRLPCPFLPSMIQAEDLDGDGHVELLVQSGGQGLAVYRGSGRVGFGPPVYVLSYAEGGNFWTADIDADGRKDMVTAAQFGFGILAWNRGAPSSYFTDPERIPESPRPETAAFGHFGNQYPGGELAVLHDEWEQLDEHTVAVHQVIKKFVPTANGFVQTHSVRYEELGSLVFSNSMRATDLDGDGDDDLVIFRGDRVEILLSVKGGGFAPVIVLHPEQMNSSGLQPALTSTHVADFNGDGCNDLGSVNRSYAIYYRTDCPTAGQQRARRLQSRPTAPVRNVSPPGQMPRQARPGRKLLTP